MKRVTESKYKKDKFYESVKTAVNTILKTSNVVSSIDVLIQIGNLTKENYERWRFKKIPYLEKVIVCNLSAISRKLKILQHYCTERGLKQSKTIYKSWGKGTKVLLRFSKFGNPRMEELYSMQYVARRKEDSKDSNHDLLLPKDDNADPSSTIVGVVSRTVQSSVNFFI
jgi:hypothetical protein